MLKSLVVCLVDKKLELLSLLNSYVFFNWSHFLIGTVWYGIANHELLYYQFYVRFNVMAELEFCFNLEHAV